LLDEPLSALDPFLRIKVRAELRRFQKELGISFIHVTHSQDEAMALADMIVVMNGGRVEQSGSPRDVFNAPRTAFVAQFIGGHNVIELDGRKIAVRADRMTLRPSGRASGRMTATVRNVEYHGINLQIALSAPDDSELTVIASESDYDAAPVRPGETAVLDWSERDVHLLS